MKRDMLFPPDGSMLVCVHDYGIPPEEFSLYVLDIQAGSIAAASLWQRSAAVGWPITETGIPWT